MRRGIVEKEIEGATDEAEKIRVTASKDGIVIDDRDGYGRRIGTIHLTWSEWEEVDKFVKEVRIKGE